MTNFLYRIFCTNKNCLNEFLITDSNKSEWTRKDKNLFDSLRLEYETIECSKCKEPHPNIFDKNNDCIFNKDKIKYCSKCNGVIPLRRLEAMPLTNICSPQCIESIKEKYAEATKEKPWPKVPRGHETCERCGSPTQISFNNVNKEFYISCSTIPKCRRMKPMPKYIDTKTGLKEYDILGSFEDLMEAALTARKNRDINGLKSINSEFYRRVENRKMKNKRPMKTAVKGYEQTNAWIEELKNK